jgi:endonuclease V-like protein UPF0215 family
MIEVKGVTKQKDLNLDTFKDIQLKKLTKHPIITVYEKPKDYPNNFVARLFDFSKPTKMIVLKDSLEEIREIIPITMVCFPRLREDDEKIVECWM